MNPAIIVFDLDDTLAQSKMPPDNEMAGLLCELLKKKKVAIISGASFTQFKKQLLTSLACLPLFKNLSLLPTNGGGYYEYDGDWKPVYEEKLTDLEKKKIFAMFEKVFSETNYQQPEKIYGTLIEDRLTSVTFSALGSEAPIELKKVWDPDLSKRRPLKLLLEKYLPEFSVAIGGATSIDVTKKGVDKAYGLEKFCQRRRLSINEVLYVGDKLEEGGNDASVKRLGVKTFVVSGLEETKKLIHSLIN